MTAYTTHDLARIAKQAKDEIRVQFGKLRTCIDLGWELRVNKNSACLTVWYRVLGNPDARLAWNVAL